MDYVVSLENYCLSLLIVAMWKAYASRVSYVLCPGSTKHYMECLASSSWISSLAVDFIVHANCFRATYHIDYGS